jgi:hypothetical protein
MSSQWGGACNVHGLSEKCTYTILVSKMKIPLRKGIGEDNIVTCRGDL